MEGSLDSASMSGIPSALDPVVFCGYIVSVLLSSSNRTGLEVI